MADPSDFYHPIIQAMIASAQNQREKANLAEKTRSAKAEEGFRQQQLAQVESQFEKQLELDQKRFEVEKQLKDLQAQHQHIENVSDLFGLTPKLGVQLVQQKPALLNAGGGQYTVNPPTLADYQSLVKTGAKAKSEGESEGALPSKLTYLGAEQTGQEKLLGMKTQAEKDLEKSKQDLEERLTNKKLDFETFKANLDARTRLAVENSAYAAHIRGIELQQDRWHLDPQTLQNAIIAEATGGTKRELNPNSPVDRAIQDGLAASGMRELSPKDKDAILYIQQVTPVLQEAEKFANTFLPSAAEHGSIGAGARALGNSIIAKTPIDTNAKAAMDALNTNVIRIARGLEDQSGGRILASQFNADMKGLPNLNQTRENALTRISELKRQANVKLDAAMAGMSPEQQKLVLNSLKMPGSAATKTYKYNAVNPANGHTIGSDNGQDWFDAKTGAAIPKQ